MKKQKKHPHDFSTLRQEAEEVLRRRGFKIGSQLSEGDAMKLFHELQVQQIELEMQNKELIAVKELAEVVSRRYAELYDFAPTGYFTLSKEGKIIELNLCGSQMLGKKRQYLKNSLFSFFISNETKPIFNFFLQKIFECETKETCEVTIFPNTKFPMHVLLTGIITENKDQCIVILLDNTERWLAEEALRESGEQNHTIILQTAMDGFWVVDLQGHLLEVNETYCQMSGYTRQELLAMRISDMEAPEVAKHIAARIEKIIAQGDDRFETRHRSKDGSIFDVEISVQYQPIKEGRLVAFLHDITNRKQAEENLRQSEERYKSLFQGNNSIMLLLDPDTGEIKDANPAASRFYGWSQSEMCKRNISEINTLSKEGVIVEMQKAKKEKRNQFFFKHRLANGELRDVEIFSGPIVFNGSTLLYSIIHDITERKLAEYALLESELKFRKYIDYAPHGIFVVNETGRYVDVNTAASKITGYSCEELLSMKITDLIPEESLEYAGNHFNSVLNKGYATDELAFLRKDGTKGYWSVDAVKLSDKIFLGFTIDITDKKNSELELKENELLLRNSQSVAHIGSYSADLIAGTWKASSEIYKIFGIDETYPNTLDGWVRLVHPDSKADLLEYNHQVEAEKMCFEREYKIIRFNDGIECWVLGLGVLEFDNQMKPVRMIGTIQDITRRKHTDETLKKLNEKLEDRVKERTAELFETNMALRQAEEKYRTVADFTYGWEYWLDQKYNMLYCSPSCERITGYKASEFIKNPKLLFDIIHPDDANFFHCHKQKEDIAQEGNREIQYRIVRFDGSIRWIGHVCQPIFDKSGNFIGNRGSNRDITGRKDIEQQLKTSNQKYKLLSENITDGIFICRNGYFEYFNKVLCHIFGFSENELDGWTLTRLVKPDYHEELENFLTSNAPLNQNLNIEIECLKKDLSTVFVEILLNYVANEGAVYGVVHDISEKKQIQKNIVKAIIQTEEKERANFSKELHDGLGPLLSTIKLYLEWSERPKTNISREEIIRKAEVTLEDALTAVKEISNKLSPHLLIYYGLSSAIKSFSGKVEETSSIRISFESNVERRIDMEIESAIYRAVIECINNTLKHALANNITIMLHDTGSQLLLKYKDDGIGFELTETLTLQKGLGLFNLQNRIHTIGGKITMFSNPGKGVEYQIAVNI